jgi:spermidine/putrescine transport system ATP-binding protein
MWPNFVAMEAFKSLLLKPWFVFAFSFILIGGTLILVSPNLFEGEIVGRAENDCLAVKVGDSTLKIPADKSKNSSGRIVFGVRPEKMTTEDVDKRRGEYDNYIQGTVLDASFTGVSVQYLVETPWGQELNIFERNVDVRELGRRGEAVDVLWRSKNVFVLDPDSDINDGLEYLGEPVAE